jgi:hypothetical protein
MLLSDLPLGEWTAHNLIGKHHIKLAVAVDTPNCLIARHAKSGAGGDVNNLLGFTISTLYSLLSIT